MFSEPVVGERFFGRKEVLDLLEKRVSALKDGYRQNVALTGQSLSGKSSIILHFLHSVKQDGLVPIYVEVVREPFRAFANKFIATILYNALQKMGKPSEVDIPRLLDLAQSVLPKTCQAVKQAMSQIEKQESDDAYMSLLGLTSILKEEAGFSCVVILDEFDNLEHLGIKNPFQGFGKVIMVQKDTMYIVSSSRNEAIKKIISEKLSLLFGNFEVLKISNFDIKASSEFIDMKFAGFEVPKELKKFLIMLTDGNPFYLSRLLAAAKAKAIGKVEGRIDESVITDAILDLVYHANGAIHQYLFNYILSLIDTKYRDGHTKIMIMIAQGNNTQSGIARFTRTKHGEVSKSLARLVELGLLSKNGIFYAIEDAMLAFWLKAVYQRRKELLVDGTFDRMELFRKDIGVIISDFIREGEKSASQRISELFNLFDNELVSIESRNMRLPHFTKVELKTVDGLNSLVGASFRGNFWIAQVYTRPVNENDIIGYLKNVKLSGCKVTHKIVVAMSGMDENAKLLAKELKISIWDGHTVNELFTFYGMKRMVVL